MLLRKPPTFLSHSKETNGRLEHELSLFDILLSIFELSWLNITWDYRLYIIHFLNLGVEILKNDYHFDSLWDWRQLIVHS